MDYKKDKYKLISHYIDNIEVERHGYKIEIKQVNLLKSYLHDQYNNHNEFGIPSNFELFKDDDGYITLNNELRTSESAIKYFTKFKQFISQYIDCNFNYHEKYYDCKTNVFDVLLKKTERIIRIIALKPDKDIEELKLGIITIDIESFKDYYSESCKSIIDEFSKEYSTLVRKEFNRLYG